MYTWGYIKNATLANLEMDEKEALQQNYLNKFIFWANEVITQVSSAIKPKRTFAEFNITSDDVFKIKTMPDDFVSFGSDISMVKTFDGYGESYRECSDDDFIYRGDKSLMFLRPGRYEISYNARWITFTDEIDNDTELNVPEDILECIPSYLAMKALKMTDAYNFTVFKNEYEVQLARIDDTHYETNGTFKIGGDW
jgi:hypothetical protein